MAFRGKDIPEVLELAEKLGGQYDPETNTIDFRYTMRNGEVSKQLSLERVLEIPSVRSFLKKKSPEEDYSKVTLGHLFPEELRSSLEEPKRLLTSYPVEAIPGSIKEPAMGQYTHPYMQVDDE